MKIAVYNEKGGSGKTALAVLLSVGLGIPLLDLDPQATATRWLERRDPPHPVVTEPSAADWVADCPPGISPAVVPILSSADLVLIPARASFSDLVTLGDAVKFVQANSRARIALAGTAIDSRTNDEATLREALAVYELPIVGMTTHRASYRRAGLLGKAPAEIDPSAATEADRIITSLKEALT